MAGAIARLGTVNIKGENGGDIETYTVPETWYNWLKDLYESPI